MATALEEFITEEQSSVVHFLWATGLNERIPLDECPTEEQGCSAFLYATGLNAKDFHK
jgi:hypothetical protein